MTEIKESGKDTNVPAKLITQKEINNIQRTAEIADRTRQIVNTIYRPSITDANYCPVRRGVHWIYQGGTK